MNSKKAIIAAVCFCGLLQFSPIALASSSLWNQQEGLGTGGEVTSVVGGTNTDIRLIVVKIINVVLTFIGIILTGLLVYAGFKYMTAAGNDDRIASAVSTIKAAVIGLIIVLASFAISSYLTSCVFDIARNTSIWICK